MASVDKRDDGRPKPWLVRWRDEAGKQRKRSFARKVDADRFRAEVEHSLNVGTYVDPAAGKTSFRAYAEAWRLAQPHRPNTAYRTRSQLSAHAYPTLGGRPLAAIRPSEIQAWVTGLDLAPSSVRPVFSTVRAIFAAAVRDRLIARSPADRKDNRISLPELPRKQVVPLTVEQVERILAAMPAAYRLAGLVAVAAGLRQGEVFGLQVGDVDLDARTLKVDRQVQLVDSRPEVAPLKNRPSYRTVPVGQALVDALKAHLEDRPDGFLFLDGAGGLLHRSRFGDQVWRPAVKSAGLSGVGFHELRHFYASALIRGGLSVKAVSARLGHGNAAETLNTYSHLWPDDEDRTRQAIDDLFRPHVPHMRPSDQE